MVIKLFDDQGGSVNPTKKPRKRKGVRTVGAQIPEEMYKILEEHIIGKAYVSASDYIRDLIRRDLEARGLL